MISKYVAIGILSIVIAIALWYIVSVFVVLIVPDLKNYNKGRCKFCGSKFKFKGYKENANYAVCMCPKCNRHVYLYHIGRFVLPKTKKNKRG